jgi:mono/diheme cytochrome c family protein
MGVAMMGKPVTSSAYGNGQVPASYATVSSDVFVSEGHSISEDHGQELYTQYCVTCHGENGQGDGPGTQNNASKGPAPFAADMGEQYINWRIHEGVPDSFMYSFKWLLSEEEIWDITVYVNNFNSTQGGGQ